jgi:hypothetical protein
MKRNTTVFVLCILLFAADLLWLRLTFDGRESLAGVRSSIEVAGQALVAATLAATADLLLRKRYARQKRPARRQEAFAPLRPLRRLFGSVLS